MPSSRQYKVLGFIALLTVLIIYYISSAASSTQTSAFYQRTVASLNTAQDSAARHLAAEQDRAHAQRVERLRVEHDVATEKQNARAPAGREAAPKVPTVTGKRTAKDGKVVEHPPATGNDGVAKVGNVEPKKSAAVQKGGGETEDEHEVEERLNEILRKGPIVVFSKSYCPYSRKAKHILQDFYTITPAPYVVELDHEPHGAALQDALQRLTGRRTVPNILVNGKSIGGGDEMQALHEEGGMIAKLQAMGGKRVTSVVQNEVAKPRVEVRHVKREFKA